MSEENRKGPREMWKDHKKLNMISDRSGRKFRNFQLNLDDGTKVQLEDRHYFILLILLEEGKATRRQIKQRVLIMSTQFMKPSVMMRDNNKKGSRHGNMDIDLGIIELLHSGMIIENEDESCIITSKGKKLAKEIKEQLETGAKHVKSIMDFFMFPRTTAIVTILIDIFLAVMKLSTGLLTGSVALIADGGDATVDAISAFVVWISMKLRKEMMGTMTIIIMMFFTAVTIGWESISSIISAFRGNLGGIYLPWIVILVEFVALFMALFLYLYQGFTGKRSGNLSLISQSIDSRNHIFVAGAVIIGAIFSMFGVHFVDALISVFIVVRILFDGVELSKEVLARRRGEEGEMECRELLYEKGFNAHRKWVFRDWILYALHCKGSLNRDDLLEELNRTFKPPYIPILSEFRIGIGRNFDFEKNIDDLLKPLMDKGLICEKMGSFDLTKVGERKFGDHFRTMRYHWG